MFGVLCGPKPCSEQNIACLKNYQYLLKGAQVLGLAFRTHRPGYQAVGQIFARNLFLTDILPAGLSPQAGQRGFGDRRTGAVLALRDTRVSLIQRQSGIWHGDWRYRLRPTYQCACVRSGQTWRFVQRIA
jgi:hypothetical protein